MRIGIDIRYLSHGLVGGVHTYVSELIPALLDIARDHEIYLYADRKRPLELASWPDNVAVRLLPWRTAASTLYHDCFLWREMSRDHLDVAHFPANVGFGPSGTRTVITLHDAINLLPLREVIRGHPKHARNVVLMTYLHFATSLAARRADLILTVSQHAAQQIASVGRIDPRVIVSTLEAPSQQLSRVSDPTVISDLRQRFGLVRSFVLADALKNPRVLVDAWKLLPETLREEREIVFFSRHPNVSAAVAEAVQMGIARLLVQPTSEELAGLYSLCSAFVFPSWMEGFGLPVLEAMTCGAPVITSNRGALPEIVGDGGLLTDAEGEEQLSRLLERLLSSPEEASRLRARGYVRAAQFSWHRTAQKTLQAYEGVLCTPKGTSQ